MKRVTADDRHIDKFGPGKDGFANEHEITGVGGTIADATSFDHFQEEIANVVEDEGIALDAGLYNQLLTAINQKDARVALAAKRDADLICSSTWRREASGLPAIVVRALACGTDPSTGRPRWVAVGGSSPSDGFIRTSDDHGETWTSRTAGSSYTGTFEGLHYAAGVFVAVGGGEVQTSTDGITWTRRATGLSAGMYAVTYDGTVWCAVGDDGANGSVVTAPTATGTWTVGTSVSGSDFFWSVASDGAGKLVAVGDRLSTTRGQISVSTDHGVTWSSEQSPLLTETLRAVTYRDGVFYAAGDASAILSSANPTGAASSSDWTVVRAGSGAAAIYGIASPGSGSLICPRGGATSNPVDPIIGHSGNLRFAAAPTSEGGFCVRFGLDGVAMMGIDGGGILRSLTFGHRALAA